MHARIRAPRRLDDDGLAAHLANGLLDHLLHAQRPSLPLPPRERRSIIFEDELVAWHQSARAGSVPTPRRNVAASIAALPSRCTSVSRTAPSPHAIVRSGSTVPGAPDTLANVERNALIRTGAPLSSNSNHAPGKGDMPRIRLCTSATGSDQSIRVSAFSIFLA